MRNAVTTTLTTALTGIAIATASLACLAGCASPSVAAQTNVSGAGNLAIDGYDPVAYFPEAQGAPTKGDPDITLTTADGATYRFASTANRDRFQRNPARYTPAHGGYCSYAVAHKSSKVDVDPTNYILDDGRVFLFYKDASLDTRAEWLKADHDDQTRLADTNWDRLTSN